MLINLVIFIFLLALAIFFIWLATRAKRAKSGFFRWVGMILSGLLAFIMILVAVFAGIGFYRLNVPLNNYQTSEMKINASAEQIAMGGRRAVLCADCHSTNHMDLDGGSDNFLADSPMGVVYAPNLTPGGELKDWTDAEVVRAIREGVDPQGKTLVIMPSQGLHALSDEDVNSIVAYLRTLPPIEHQTPERALSFMSLVLIGSNKFPLSAQTPITELVVAPPEGTMDYGKYITDAYGCRDCHGLDFRGNEQLGGPNLIGVVSNWSEDQFVQVFKSGTDPGGRQISDEMPWRGYNVALSDSALHDLYVYMHSLTN